MHFLYPTFLFAMVALAIPVIVHLFNFRRYQRVMFSNVQFLKELQEQQASRRNLKERLILAARLLAILFLVLAFAKPFIPHDQSVNVGKQQLVSIFVDNSYSMQTLSKEGSLLDEAKRHAKEIAASYGINDRFQLLTQDMEGKHQRLLSRDEFNDAVDAVRIGPQSRDLQQIVDRQESLIKAQGGTASIFVLSDFQSNMDKQKVIKADSGVILNLVQLKANNLPNVAIDSIWLLSAVHRPDENEKLVVRLHNYADQEAKSIPLKLSINGIQKAQGSFSLAPRAVQNDTLAFSGLQAGWQRGELVLQDNPITFDNRFDFTFDVKNQVPVLLINGGTSNPYLTAAFATDKFFVVNNTRDGNVDYTGLSSYPLVVLSDVKTISAGLAQQLKVYVDKGGSLVVFPAPDADLDTYRSLLQPLRAAYPNKLVSEAAKVTALNLQSKIFKNVFEQLPENPDLPVVSKYYQLTQPTQSVSENIMRMAGNSPLLGSYKSGAGQVYVSAVPLDEEFSNLPRHAMLLPILFRITLLSGHDQPLFYSVGEDETIEAPPIQLDEKQVLKLVKGNNSIIPDTRTQEGSTLLYVSDQLKETGNYELKKQDSVLSVIAFNDNRRESDMSYLTEARLRTWAPRGNVINAATPSLKSELNNINIGLQLWKLFVVLALVFIAVEILLVRFYKVDRQRAAVTT